MTTAKPAAAAYGATGQGRIDLQHQTVVIEGSHPLDPRHPVEVVVPFAQLEVLYLSMRQLVLQAQGQTVQMTRGPVVPEAGSAPVPSPGILDHESLS